MKRDGKIRWLLVACTSAAPFFAGTGCGGRLLDTGDTVDAGTDGAAGSSGMGGTSGSAGGTRGGSGGSSSGAAGTSSVIGGGGASGTTGAAGSPGNDGGPGTCTLPKVRGPCEALFQRWWLNPQSGQCERFTYGGCEGNANNFETVEECVVACVPGTGQPCGSIRCSPEQGCCNPSCSICATWGDACVAITCKDPCAAHDAEAEGSCLLALGYKWDGLACFPLGGCRCVGSDCGLLTSLEACKQAHAGCNDVACATELRAITAFIDANKSCAVTADCQQQTVGCNVTEDGCTGTVYVNTSTNLSVFEQLRKTYTECAGGCGQCKRATLPAACVAGKCVAQGTSAP